MAVTSAALIFALVAFSTLDASTAVRRPPTTSIYSKYKRTSTNALYDAYRIPVKMNYTMTRIIEGSTPPGTIAGNYYHLTGDIWVTSTDASVSRLGRYQAGCHALGDSKDFPVNPGPGFLPVALQCNGAVEFNVPGPDPPNDSIIFTGTQDISIADLPSAAAPTKLQFLDNDLAVTGGTGFWVGAAGHLKVSEAGSIQAGTGSIGGQPVPTLVVSASAILFAFRPLGGLDML